MRFVYESRGDTPLFPRNSARRWYESREEMAALAGGQKRPLCLAWGGSSSEPPVPIGHVDGEDRPHSGHLCGLITEDQPLTPNPRPGYCV